MQQISGERLQDHWSSCFIQVAVLSQFLDEIDYATAFKALQERNTYDAMDTYYVCIWDISILEYLVRILYCVRLRSFRPGPEIIKLSSCSTLLSMEFQLILDTENQNQLNVQVSIIKACNLACLLMLKFQQLLSFYMYYL